MKNTSIGILDLGLDNISILNSLYNGLRSESFFYVNDLACHRYEGLENNIILKRVENSVDFLLKQKIKLLIVISAEIIEYCQEYFNSLPIPVINIVDTIISCVNRDFEHRNMLLLARKDILNANLFQKNFEYNHLYNIDSEKLERIVLENKTKTSLSFHTTQELFKPIAKKDVNVIIPVSVALENLLIEFREYLPNAKLLDLGNEIVEKTKAALLTIDNLNIKGKGKIKIFINVDKDKVNIKHLLNIKYKIFERPKIVLLDEKNENNKKYLLIDKNSEEAKANLNKSMLGSHKLTVDKNKSKKN